jgi:hypothetical protein
MYMEEEGKIEIVEQEMRVNDKVFLLFYILPPFYLQRR